MDPTYLGGSITLVIMAVMVSGFKGIIQAETRAESWLSILQLCLATGAGMCLSTATGIIS